MMRGMFLLIDVMHVCVVVVCRGGCVGRLLSVGILFSVSTHVYAPCC